jgi:hypothetical protein
VKVGVFFNHSKENLADKNSIGWNRGSFAFEIDDKGVIQVYSYVYPKESLLTFEHNRK